MTSAQNINRELANKFYLYSVGLYAAVACVFGGLYLFTSLFGWSQIISIFVAYFTTVLWRAYYEQLAIYNIKIKQISFKNNLILATIGALVLAILYYYLKPPLGDWSVPITIIISMRIIKKVKEAIWSNNTHHLPEILKTYSQKLNEYTYGLYGFFIGVALITYLIIKLFGTPSFYLAFALAILISLLFEQYYEFISIYKIKLSLFKTFITFIIGIIFALLGTTLVFTLMQFLSFSGKTATITAIIGLKLIQPLISNRLLEPYKK